jgi:predicted TIM-barrel enzyme
MVGSGLNVDNAETFFRYADGSFVGSSLKVDGDADNDVDKERVAAFMERMKSLRA